MNEEKLSGFVKLVRDEGGNVEILRFPNEKIRILQLQWEKWEKPPLDWISLLLRMILKNLEDFEIRANNNDFVNWFDTEIVDVKEIRLSHVLNCWLAQCLNIGWIYHFLSLG